MRAQRDRRAPAEAIVLAAMVERLSNPQAERARRAHYGLERAVRARIEGDIARWQDSADELALKTARWEA